MNCTCNMPDSAHRDDCPVRNSLSGRPAETLLADSAAQQAFTELTMSIIPLMDRHGVSHFTIIISGNKGSFQIERESTPKHE